MFNVTVCGVFDRNFRLVVLMLHGAGHEPDRETLPKVFP
jgi:hypothetical protein